MHPGRAEAPFAGGTVRHRGELKADVDFDAAVDLILRAGSPGGGIRTRRKSRIKMPESKHRKVQR